MIFTFWHILCTLLRHSDWAISFIRWLHLDNLEHIFLDAVLFVSFFEQKLRVVDTSLIPLLSKKQKLFSFLCLFEDQSNVFCLWTCGRISDKSKFTPKSYESCLHESVFCWVQERCLHWHVKYLTCKKMRSKSNVLI